MYIFNIFIFFIKSNTCRHFIGAKMTPNRIRQIFKWNLIPLTKLFFWHTLGTFEFTLIRNEVFVI